MRMRSPRMAPPVYGLDGSTATTPTRCPRARYASMRRSQRVDLPAPGLPVTPSTQALPVCGQSALRRSLLAGAASSTRRSARPIARARPPSTPFTRSSLEFTGGTGGPALLERRQLLRDGPAIDGPVGDGEGL